MTASTSRCTWLACLVAGLAVAVATATRRGESADAWVPRADADAIEPDSPDGPETIASAPKRLESDLEAPTSWVALGEKRARRGVRSEDSALTRDASPTWPMDVLLGRLDDANAAFEREDLAAARELAQSIEDDDIFGAAALVDAAQEPRDEGDRGTRRALWPLTIQAVRETLRSQRFEAMHAALDATKLDELGACEVNLALLVASLRRRTRLAVHVLPDTWKQGGARLRFDPGEFEGATATSALDRLVSLAGDLGWELRDDDVTIGPASEVGQARLRYFDVTPRFPRQSVKPEPSALQEADRAEPFVSERIVTAFLADLRQSVDPDSWTAEHASLDVKNGTLIAKNHAGTLHRLGTYLEATHATLPRRHRTSVTERSRDVHDLVGSTSSDASVLDASLAVGPWNPGALIAALDVLLPDEVPSAPSRRLTIERGVLRIRADDDGQARIGRALDEWIANARGDGPGQPRTLAPPTYDAYFNDGSDGDFRGRRTDSK